MNRWPVTTFVCSGIDVASFLLEGLMKRIAWLLLSVGCSSELEVCLGETLQNAKPAVREAIQMWADKGAAITEGCPGDVKVQFGEMDSPPASARTFMEYTGPIRVVLDWDRPWTHDSVRRHVAHELGHAAGIEQHSQDRSCIMFSSASAQALCPDDVERWFSVR